ncbi:hypothetical protein MKZ38_001239 [Zalerion maritima]|uniref:Uncharacterized protein n=1 Tax=Zalerion maritima TaxID=339359 RepID=A0AAD5WRL9_9PEZI|nr:hypothetical protein MKZ38_001239 [Zalerion maritima]
MVCSVALASFLYPATSVSSIHDALLDGTRPRVCLWAAGVAGTIHEADLLLWGAPVPLPEMDLPDEFKDKLLAPSKEGGTGRITEPGNVMACFSMSFIPHTDKMYNGIFQEMRAMLGELPTFKNLMQFEAGTMYWIECNYMCFEVASYFTDMPKVLTIPRTDIFAGLLLIGHYCGRKGLGVKIYRLGKKNQVTVSITEAYQDEHYGRYPGTDEQDPPIGEVPSPIPTPAPLPANVSKFTDLETWLFSSLHTTLFTSHYPGPQVHEDDGGDYDEPITVVYEKEKGSPEGKEGAKPPKMRAPELVDNRFRRS